MPVFLKKIELFGFKSFADRTKIEFVSPITGIVGPNGSGKSNIVDAIKWCLGENSPKTLRGSGFEDILFLGSQYRQPLSVAEVSLLFDNSTRILQLPLDEVEIVKRYYRSGETKTLMNKNEVRVKDIVNLFLGTGFGKEGYSIIGQNEIDKLIVGEPTEKRNYIDELLGISKAKFKKREAEKRLKGIIADIEKISISFEQTEREYIKVKEQAKKAEEYREIESKIEFYEKSISKSNLEKYKQKLSDLELERKRMLEEIKKILEDISQVENQIKDIDGQLQEISITLEQKRGKFSEIEKKINEKEMEKKEILSKIEIHNRSINSLRKEAENLEKRKKLLFEEKELANLKLKEISDFVPILNEKISSLKDEINRLEEELKSKDERKAKNYEFINFCQSVLKDIEILEKEVESNLTRETEIDSEISLLVEKISSLKSDLLSIEEQKESKAIELRNLESRREEIKKQIDQVKRHINTLNEIAKQTQSAIRDLTNESEKLFNEFSREIGRNAIVIGNFMKKVREISEEIVSRCDSANSSADIVNLINDIKGLANSLLTELSGFPSFISDEFFKRRDKIEKEIALLNQKLESLGVDAERQKGDLSKLNEELNEVERSISSIEKDLSFLSKDIKSFNFNISSYEEELSRKYDDLEKSKSKNEILEERRNNLLLRALEKLENYYTYLREESVDIEGRIGDLRNLSLEEKSSIVGILEGILNSLDIETINKSINEIKLEISRRKAELDQLQSNLFRSEAEKNTIISRLGKVQKEIEEIDMRMNEIKNEVERCQKEIEDLTPLVSYKDEEIAQLRVERDELLKEIGDQSLRNKKMSEEFKNYIDSLNKLKDDEVNKNKLLHELTSKLEITNGQIERLKSSIFEKYAVDIESFELPDDFDQAEYQRNLERLRKLINDLGNVNFSAIDDLPELEERYKFLKFNYDDLYQSKVKLEGVISDINKEIETIVSSSMGKIEEIITTVFKDVFGGGGVRIEMDHDDLVEGGVEFVVSIPGKKIKNILLLSGGEKALVSIIFIFSALMINNTPLVVLDEIDAALDDENTERFKKLVKTFESKAQFIVISHNKSVLDICNSIYGVTMEERGVSKVVSYQLQNAVTLF